MSGPEFFETRMGQKFYDGDVPRLVRALESIAASLEQLAERLAPPLVDPAQQPPLPWAMTNRPEDGQK